MTDYYFDGDNGNDSNDGLTSSTPRKIIKPSTIGGVFNPSNLRLFIKRGTSVRIDVSAIHPQGPFYIGPYGDGTAKPTVVYNYGGSYYFAVGTGATSTDTIEFEDLILQDNDTSSSVAAVYQNDSGSGKIVVTGCDIYDFFHGVMTQRGNGHIISNNNILRVRNCGVILEHTSVAAPSNTVISNNYIDCRLADGSLAATSNDCITLHNGASNGYGNVVSGNTLVSGVESCIDVATQYHGTLVDGNVCYARFDSTSTSWADIYCAGANSIIRRNLVFANYRTGIQLGASGITVSSNVVKSAFGYGASPLIYAWTGSSGAVVHNNLLLAQSGYASVMFLAASGIVPGTLINNSFVNESANSAVRFLSFAAADIPSWLINNNHYAQISGSYATPFLGAQTFAQWQARTGTPDVNGISDTVSRFGNPSYSNVGQKFDIGSLVKVDDANALIGDGRHLRYGIDINGHQFYNPPTIGPAEYIRSRSARV